MGKKVHPVAEYMRDVLSGRIVAGLLVRLAVQRQVRDIRHGAKRGLVFREDRAQRVIDFFQFLRHSKGKWARTKEPIKLEGWEQFILWCVFGWYRKDGTRRFRTAYNEVARKNGKSTFSAGVGIYAFVADGEPGAEVYSAATKRDQARIIHGEAIRMVRKSPGLKKKIKIVKDNMSIIPTDSKFEPLGKDSDTLDGLNSHVSLVDELHAHKTREVWDLLETSTGARESPLMWAITTAGNNQVGICYEQREYAEQLLRQVIEDDSFFAFIATIDEGDRWDNPKVWAKANPNLHVSVNMDYLKEKCHAARLVPAKQNSFLQRHLNKWVQQANRWLSLDLWDENVGVVDEEALKGCLCYGALDLSSVSDMTAIVYVFPIDDRLKVLARFFVPQEKLTNRENRFKAQYQTWASLGFLQTTEGNALDYETIEASVVNDSETFQIRKMAIDILFQGHQMEQNLREKHGIDMVASRTGMITMSPPTKELERLLLSHRLEHGGNPILRWMADNVAVKQDHLENIMPSKTTSQGKIDGIVALIMAINCWLKLFGDDETSKYEKEELALV